MILLFTVSAVQAQKSRSKIDSVKLELKTLEVEKQLMQANLAKNNGDLRRALELYFNVLNIDKTCAVAYYEVAGLFMYSKSFSAATQYAQKAVYYNSSQAAYVERLAQIYMLQGNQKKLQETLRQLQKLNKSLPNQYVDSVKISENATSSNQVKINEENAEPKHLYEQIVQNPTNVELYEIATKQYVEKQPAAWDSVAIINEMALNYFPSSAQYYLQAAQAHIELTNYERAIELLNNALEFAFVSNEERKEIENQRERAKALNTTK